MGKIQKLTNITPRALTGRLAFRIGVGLLVGAAAVLVAAGAWNVRHSREQMESILASGAIRVAETIRRSTRDAMLRNNPDDVNRILSCIGDQRGVERIRIFDKEGKIRVSTHSAEVNEVIDKSAEECVGCHRARETLVALQSSERIRTYENPDGERILGVTSAIVNEPDCTIACHDGHAHAPEEKLLGVIDVHLSLGPVDAFLAENESQAALTIGVTVLVMLVVVGLLLWRMVLRPVRQLTHATTALGHGELSTRVEIDSNDELGELGLAWNTMATELGTAHEDLEELNRTLEERVARKTQALESAHQRMLVVEKMASLGKLAAIVAHEVNNPLAGIGTYAKLLKKKLVRRMEQNGATEEEQATEKILAMMEEEANRCGKIVRNLLMFSRTPGPCFSETELRPLLERCILLVNHQAELQGVEIRLEAPPHLPKLDCDASQIQQVVLVLSMNAIEAMPTGGVLGIKANFMPDTAEVAILFGDTGCGIAEGKLGRVFEPFYSTKEEGKGVGLGLAVAYGIVQRHKGRIELESAIGKGTTFSVYLPLFQEEDAEPESAAEIPGMTPPGKI